ncbi:MAG TPA: CapA family protein [Jatrophihabitans sp.]|nr:CapA family protein [Jatrophihabitans sp.]
MSETVTLLLTGDVMLGRGVDQILRHPSDPALAETYVRDARRYVELAERRNGPIPRPVDESWLWGDAVDVLTELAPDARLINLETAITRDGEFAPGKAVHYRMSPDNVASLAGLAPDVCALANNHVLDFGVAGLLETLDVLADARIHGVGAGRDEQAARAPAVVPCGAGGRLLVVGCGTPSSGIPPNWAATDARPGVHLLTELTARRADELAASVAASKRPGDVAVVSIHWGSNWGYAVEPGFRRFAHRLVDGGVDLVHGHSSHHPRPIEIYRGRLILYGCGDFLDDYEGIGGHDDYRAELTLMYFATLAVDTGRLVELRMVPLRISRIRLRHVEAGDLQWVRTTLEEISRPSGTRVDVLRDGMLLARPA